MEQVGNLRNKLLLIVTLLLLFSCGEEPKSVKKSTPQKVERKKAVRPEFSSDSAYHYIKAQVGFGPRVPNTEAHRKTATYLVNKLKSFNLEVTEQDAQVIAYDGTKLNIKNIFGAFKPELNNRVLLFSHWDSRPFADQDDERQDEAILGANDGASGVGVLLEIARQLQINEPTIGVDIAFFDAEDYGEKSGNVKTWALGSQYWAKTPHKMGYSANYGILLDMVGAKDAVFTKESHSMFYAKAYMEYVWNIAKDLGHDDYFVSRVTNFVGIDDHIPVNETAKIPSIDIIQYDNKNQGFGDYWHTHDDNMDVIDRETLQAVGETVLAAVMMEGK